MAVRVAVIVPIVGVAVVVDRLVIPSHGVDVEHRQDPHGGHSNEQHHPSGKALSLLTQSEFTDGEGLSVHATPETGELPVSHQAFPPAR